MSRLFPVFYISGLSIRLLSLGTLLNDSFILRGTVDQLNFYQRSRLQMQLNPHVKGDTLFWLRARVTSAAEILAKSTVLTVDYETLHRCFGHPSKDVLRKPKELKFLLPILFVEDVQKAKCLQLLSLQV